MPPDRTAEGFFYGFALGVALMGLLFVVLPAVLS